MDEVIRSNAVLNSYFNEVASMSVDDTKHIEKTVMSHIYDIVRCIHEMDPLFSAIPVGVGSAYQELKVNLPDEFDLSILLLGIEEWNVELTKEPLNFGFSGVDDSVTTVIPGLRIIPKRNPLRNPGVEYYAVRINEEFRSKYAEFVYDGFLIPYKVKSHLKNLILKAIRKLNLTGVSLDPMVHGPALTLNVQHQHLRELAYIRVNIDMAVVLESVKQFDIRTTDWEIRAQDYAWPDSATVRKIKNMRINLVAKKNFHWALSFAECEKALVLKMDADGGIRKKVHRIMKSLWREATNNGTISNLTTYMLKNVWLLECQDASQWSPEYLSDRYYSGMEKLKHRINERRIPVYFCNSINLLKGKSDSDIQGMLIAIQDMQRCLIEFKVNPEASRRHLKWIHRTERPEHLQPLPSQRSRSDAEISLEFDSDDEEEDHVDHSRPIDDEISLEFDSDDEEEDHVDQRRPIDNHHANTICGCPLS